MIDLVRTHRPDCLVTDYLYPWSADVSAELGIPRLAFSGSGFFNLCIADSIEANNPHAQISSESEEFVVPGIPNRVTLTRSQLPDIVKGEAKLSRFFDKLKQAERRSYGVIVNTFHSLEAEYADHYRRVTGLKAWQLGPVSLFINRNFDDKINRGGKSDVNAENCLNWLDSMKPNSVLYICLGSLTRFSKPQITEISRALEESSHPFIWVLAKILKPSKEQWWLPEGFENRVKQSGKGLIIRGWAPQMAILEHASIGGFVTHCGWNSIMEGVCAGVPMVTWPIFAEQFYNEKLVTQVMKFGVSVGNEVWLRSAVEVVMGGGVEAAEMRRKAVELGKEAKRAVGEGGTSSDELKGLLEEIRGCKSKRRGVEHVA
ncbi:unnamed protein product [Linum tenue]|uniref:anthocyanidin 3-O-glucosyltransferase n=1 Tax=Linum tenue TaxID=586396 RepID=A0AAV0P2Y2_9ROSI|nr:unnamed protein product [Linum tenue]